MRTAYLTRDGGVLRRDGDLLYLELKGERVGEVRLGDIDQLVVMGPITLTPAAMDLLLWRHVDTVLLSSAGSYRGRLDSGAGTNATLRMAQYKLLAEEGAGALEFARRVVDGKLHNQRSILLRHARRHGNEAAEAAAKRLGWTRSRLVLAETVDEVRGCEGAGAAHYFAAFGSLIRVDGMPFRTRSRRPPLDAVNALLSFGYTLLYSAVEAQVRIVGLDPCVGALHAIEPGRASLVCDLVEELRAPLIDALVLAAVNNRALGPSDFEGEEGDPVVMKPDARHYFLRLYERRLARKVPYAPLGYAIGWRQVMLEQARRAARHMLGKSPYEPFRWA